MLNSYGKNYFLKNALTFEAFY